MGANPKSSGAQGVKTSGRRRLSSLPELVRILPPQQLIYLWLAIVCTFSMIGFVLDILTQGRAPAALLTLNVIFSGLFAFGYAKVSMPMRKWGYAAMVTAHMTALRDGTEVTKLYPARWFFHGREDEPTTEVAIRRSMGGDLYIVMPSYDVAEQSATLEITVTPLINWLWLGFGVLANLTTVWALSLLMVLPLLPVQETLNRCWSERAPDAVLREDFTPRELAAMALGASAIVAALILEWVALSAPQ